MAKSRTEGLDIKVLEDKETLLYFGDDPKIDRATGTFVGGWHSAGLEPADSTFELSREVTSNTTQLTGGQSATDYTKGALTSTTNVIPGSPALDYIEWPETTEKNGTLYRKHSNKVAKAYVARVHKFQSGVIGVMVSREKADLTVAARTTGNAPSARAIAATYKNGDDGYAVEEMFYRIDENGAVVEVQEKIFQTVADVATQVTDGTAFIPDASGEGTAMEATVVSDGDADLINLS
ncbi:RNA polymerase sigma factor [Corynebacterium deserti GIMN1.010]|uniref:RNA polymerase sigma factor n=1 Tax=Corynebacterium deserti GIMN1.010 TaxID=931089 RepID=A0A0M4CQ40_9CORY|nr:hypothetical protein [Corynebacterium deserti]ALC05917.1 RNA polymerase sigma factor [Corynebacterium deserti GIMN1.010]